MLHSQIRFARALLFATATLTGLLAPAARAADVDQGLLGNELDDLQQAVDALLPDKSAAEIVTPPGAEKLPGFLRLVNPDGDNNVTVMRGDPGEITKPGGGGGSKLPDGAIAAPGAVLTGPGGIVIPPPADSRPVKPLMAPTKGTIDEDAFDFDRKTGPSFVNGMLVFNAPDEDHSALASHRNIKGDFDLRVDYTLEPTDAKKLVGAAFGIRLDSPTREQQVTVDRRINEGGDKVFVGRSRELKPVFSAKANSLGGVMRVQRRGDQYTISHGNADGTQWTDLGEVTVPLTNEVNFWLIAFTDWGGTRVTVHRVDVTKPGE